MGMHLMEFHKLDTIVIHSSATKAHQDFTRDDIRRWHKEKNWSDIGYHMVIERSGVAKKGRDENYQGAHAFGHNNSIGICLVGGLGTDGSAEFNFNWRQIEEMKIQVFNYLKKYPQIKKVCGHRDLGNTKCPSFSVEDFFRA